MRLRAVLQGRLLTLTATATTGAATVTVTATGGGLTRSVPVALTVTSGGGGGTGGVTVTPVIASSSNYFNDQQVRLASTGGVSGLSVTLVIQRTAGVGYGGQYNTVGGSITQASSVTASTLTYTYTLGAGLTLGAGTYTFAAQTSGSGTPHPMAGDTFTVTYTSGAGVYADGAFLGRRVGPGTRSGPGVRGCARSAPRRGRHCCAVKRQGPILRLCVMRWPEMDQQGVHRICRRCEMYLRTSLNHPLENPLKHLSGAPNPT
jgi:hypothetical protein